MSASGARSAGRSGAAGAAKGRGAAASAFVLHRYDWSETSLILDLFTREQGRVTVVAKGAKRPYSQLRPVLLPFQRIQATLSKPAREEPVDLLTLRGAEWAGGAPMLAGAALFTGFYLNELLMKLLPRGEPLPVLFDAYHRTLPALAAQDDVLTQAALRAFEIVLLSQTGLLPRLDRLGTHDAFVAEAGAYQLRPELGIVPHSHQEAPLTGATLVALQAALDAGDLTRLQLACAQALPALKTTSRQWLHYHLGGARLRTREVMIASQQLGESVAPTSASPLSKAPDE